jgi:uracil-DNA glycosylase
MSISIHPSRNPIITPELGQPYFADLQETLAQKTQAGNTVYPAPADIFKAFDLTSRNVLSVVILGQDPYHQPGQAMGLAFSVPSHIPKPPSLQNIYKELANQYP